MKRLLASLKEYTRHIDSTVVGHAVFGLLAIGCALASCALNFSWSTFFDFLKDAFNTVMVFFVLFVSLIHLKKRFSEAKDKLDYIDFWDEYSDDIYAANDMTLFEKPLLYGLQAATFSDEITKLSDRIDTVLENEYYSNTTQTAAVLNATRAMLSVFFKTERLTKSLSHEELFGAGGLLETLSKPYEKDIRDRSLAAWCEIMRKDKLELAYEMYAAGLKGEDKLEPLYTALSICKDCVVLINNVVEENPADANYALLYSSYINRNIAQIHKALYDIKGAAKDFEIYREYTVTTLKNRIALYNVFCEQRKSKSIAKDYIEQEYMLALAEEYKFEKDHEGQSDIPQKLLENYELWLKRNRARAMIFEKIKDALVEAKLIEVETNENSVTM